MEVALGIASNLRLTRRTTLAVVARVLLGGTLVIEAQASISMPSPRRDHPREAPRPAAGQEGGEELTCDIALHSLLLRSDYCITAHGKPNLSCPPTLQLDIGRT